MMTTQNDANTLRAWLCRAALGGADRLAAYGEGALSLPRAARVERHLSTCPACREELATLREMSALLLARRPAAPAPAADLWRRIQAEIEAVPALPVRAPAAARRSFLVPALSTAALGALAAVTVLTRGHSGSEALLPPAPPPGGAARVATVTPSMTAAPLPFFGGGGASSLGGRTGFQAARAVGASAKPAPNREAAPSFAPEKRIAATRSRSGFPTVEDPFVPLRSRASRRRFLAKSNERRDRGGVTFAPKTILPPVGPGKELAQHKRPSPEIAPDDENGGATWLEVPPLAPGGEDPAGPSPTLTAARGVAASDSAVTRYLSDNRRSGLFRYASFQAASAPSQPDSLR